MVVVMSPSFCSTVRHPEEELYPYTLVIYDGDCGFCSRALYWLQSRAPRIEAQAFQRLSVEDLASYALCRADVETAVWFLESHSATLPRGGKYDKKTSGGIACARALKYTTARKWQIFGGILLLPGVKQIIRGVYPLIARNRHRLPGASDACRL